MKHIFTILLFTLLLITPALATTPNEPVTVYAHKVVCEAEEYLPNWALAGTEPGEPATITATTAADFVAANSEHCWLADDWDFQWGYNPVDVLPGDHIGPAPTGTDDDEWKDFDTSTNAGPATVEIYDLKNYNQLWFREVLQEGYVPFANPPGDLQDPVSAEMLCRTDVLNFDNYDWIRNMQYGENYHCVAFNALEEAICGDGVVTHAEECDGSSDVENYMCNDQCELEYVPFCGDDIVNQESEECDGSTDEENYICTNECTLEYVPFCGDNEVNQNSEQCDGSDGVGPNQECSEQCTLIDLPFCGDGEVNQPSEECDGSGVGEQQCSEQCTLLEPVTVYAHKVVCEAEEYLPNWGLSGTQPGEPATISATTAADFVAANSDYCWLADDWDFQWGYAPVPKPSGDFIGPMPVGTANNQWKNFDTPTQNGSPAEVEIYDLKHFTKLWFKENLQEGYVPFSNPPGDLQDDVSAEMYCRTDVLHFDNYDWIQNMNYGSTYHCVAFNALEEPEPICGNGVLEEDEQCDGTAGVGPNQECSAQCTLIDLPFCGDNVVNQESEECDGSAPENYQCTNECTLEYIPFCGDDVVNQESEQCDGTDGVGPNQECSEQCVLVDLPFCGDGEVNQDAEQCDGTAGVGPNQECSEQCTLIDLPFCGDNVVNQESEECDGSAPEGYSCTQTCELEPTSCLDINYTNLYYTNGTAQWIDTVSRVELLVDQEASACMEATHYYDPIPVANEYCVSTCNGWQPQSGEGTAYAEAFGLAEESCYVIEYYTEFETHNVTGWDCVFSDKTAPVIEKTIGAPHQNMTQLNREQGSIYYPELDPETSTFCDEPGACVEVTLDTPISVSCSDVGNQPSGVDNICFTVGLDGDDATASYCNEGNMENGRCCMGADAFDFQFTEDSWHELNLTCIDNVGKNSSHVEYFKVDGNAFEIQLNNKWNLISTPYALFNNDIEAVFAGHEDSVASVWTYENEQWYVYTPDGIDNDNLETMQPGWGYWVLATQNDTLLLSGTLLSPAATPPSKEIVPGWNLVGVYDVTGAPTGDNGLLGYYGPEGNGVDSSCAFSSLSSNVWDEALSSVWGYWELYNPDSWLAISENSTLDPGAGYWLFADEEGIYAPAANCSTSSI